MTMDFSSNVEVAGIKTTANINVERSLEKTTLESSPSFRLIAGVKKAIDPVGFAQKEAEASIVKLKADIEKAKLLLPWLTDKQASLVVLGYHKTVEQADNIFSVLEEAGSLVEGDVKPLLPEFRDAVIEGASASYDETVRAMWAELVSKECNEPGTFSKRAVSILSDMTIDDADKLKRVCALCIGGPIPGIGHVLPVIPFLQSIDGGAAYGDGSVSFSDVIDLEALGIVKTGGQHTLKAEGGVSLGTSDGVAYRFVPTEHAASSLSLGDVVFTSAGRELALLCDLGVNPALPGLLKDFFEKNGFDCL